MSEEDLKGLTKSQAEFAKVEWAREVRGRGVSYDENGLDAQHLKQAILDTARTK